jgi:hypothetical protein
MDAGRKAHMLTASASTGITRDSEADLRSVRNTEVSL